jgi:hypothetical protein
MDAMARCFAGGSDGGLLSDYCATAAGDVQWAASPIAAARCSGGDVEAGLNMSTPRRVANSHVVPNADVVEEKAR